MKDPRAFIAIFCSICLLVTAVWGALCLIGLTWNSLVSGAGIDGFVRVGFVISVIWLTYYIYADLKSDSKKLR